MTTAYIKNKGITQTSFQDNHNHKKTNEIKWNANYDGNLANIKVDVKNNGKKNKYRMQLNNEDLANILSIPTVNQPLERRLHNDFLGDDDDCLQEDEYFIPPFSEPPQQLELPKQLEPEPMLFRLNIPDSQSKRQNYSSPFSKPCINNNELTSLPDLTSLSIPESFASEPPLIYKPRLTRRERNARLRTPLPKTMRIHYTTASAKGRGITKRKKRAATTRKKGKVSKFFSKLF